MIFQTVQVVRWWPLNANLNENLNAVAGGGDTVVASGGATRLLSPACQRRPSPGNKYTWPVRGHSPAPTAARGSGQAEAAIGHPRRVTGLRTHVVRVGAGGDPAWPPRRVLMHDDCDRPPRPLPPAADIDNPPTSGSVPYAPIADDATLDASPADLNDATPHMPSVESPSKHTDLPCPLRGNGGNHAAPRQGSPGELHRLLDSPTGSCQRRR